MAKPHISIHPSGENHVFTQSGVKATVTQAGLDLFYGSNLKDRAIESATSSSKPVKN